MRMMPEGVTIRKNGACPLQSFTTKRFLLISSRRQIVSCLLYPSLSFRELPQLAEDINIDGLLAFKQASHLFGAAVDSMLQRSQHF